MAEYLIPIRTSTDLRSLILVLQLVFVFLVPFWFLHVKSHLCGGGIGNTLDFPGFSVRLGLMSGKLSCTF